MIFEITDAFFSKYPFILEQESLAVAVSGGPDSMALALILAQAAEKHNKTLHMITVDHQLRPEAKAEAAMIGKWVQSLPFKKIRHEILIWQTEKPDAAIMEKARQARYELMAAYCEKKNIKSLFIAHHRDDQAETFLIRLTAGSGLDGLAGMHSVRPYNENLYLLRPLLEVPKEDLIAYCQKNGVPFVQDPSNENEDYLRPRLRQSMDILEAEGLSAKRLAVTAKRLARARQALEFITTDVFTKAVQQNGQDCVIINFEFLSRQPEEIGFRVVQRALEDMREDSYYNVRLERLEELFSALWSAPENFKPRTLGGFIFKLEERLKNLKIEKEQG